MDKTSFVISFVLLASVVSATQGYGEHQLAVGEAANIPSGKDTYTFTLLSSSDAKIEMRVWKNTQIDSFAETISKGGTLVWPKTLPIASLKFTGTTSAGLAMISITNPAATSTPSPTPTATSTPTALPSTTTTPSARVRVAIGVTPSASAPAATPTYAATATSAYSPPQVAPQPEAPKKPDYALLAIAVVVILAIAAAYFMRGKDSGSHGKQLKKRIESDDAEE